jgi:hypothetical protein
VTFCGQVWFGFGYESMGYGLAWLVHVFMCGNGATHTWMGTHMNVKQLRNMLANPNVRDDMEIVLNIGNVYADNEIATNGAETITIESLDGGPTLVLLISD